MPEQTIAQLIPTLSWSWSEGWDEIRPRPSVPRQAVARESMRWQELSAHAAAAEMEAYPSPFKKTVTLNGVRHVIDAGQGKPPREHNRLLEVHGLMGAIGEQLGLAWSAEQDVQRLFATADSRDAITNRLMIRSISELAGHFVLGAAHSLANLVLRILLLNTDAAETLIKAYKGQAFPPGSDERGAWPTFGPRMSRHLLNAATAGGNSGMLTMTSALTSLEDSGEFRALDGRRGMDYHRRRPQSVPHTAPRAGTVHTSAHVTKLSMVSPRLEADADEIAVHAVVSAALDRLSLSMSAVRRAIPDSIREEGITYIYDFVGKSSERT